MSMHRKTITLTEQQNGWVKARLKAATLATIVNTSAISSEGISRPNNVLPY